MLIFSLFDTEKKERHLIFYFDFKTHIFDEQIDIINVIYLSKVFFIHESKIMQKKPYIVPFIKNFLKYIWKSFLI